jgi:hypothetical protein
VQVAFATTTPVNQLAPGERVIVQGVVQGTPGTVVIQGHLSSCGKGGPCWRWSGSVFLLGQGSASVYVDATNLASVSGAPRYSSDGSQASYQVGDTVAIAGTVEKNGGVLEIAAADAGTDTQAVKGLLQTDINILLVAWGLGTSLLALALVVVAIGRRRRRISEESVAAFQSKLASRPLTG